MFIFSDYINNKIKYHKKTISIYYQSSYRKVKNCDLRPYKSITQDQYMLFSIDNCSSGKLVYLFKKL